jgi:hypothetical protein
MALGTPTLIAGPAYIANSATNIYTPSSSPIGTVITHIHIANVDSSAHTFSLYIGATGGSSGGTQIEAGYSVAANSDFDKYFSPGIPLASTQFLSGIADTASKLVITVMGWLRVIG